MTADSPPDIKVRSLTGWVDYIQTLHARSIDLGLERVAQVWARMRPATMPPVIAVAGTNGKGSSISMLESIYRLAGYRTGAFTSPHLVYFNERICLDNIPVSDAQLLMAFERVEQIRGDVALTFFEFNTLLALELFCRSELDVILLEVGMGGRLDAVNMVDNDLALITAIGLDHCAWLGDDLETIAAEKAGVIKAGGRAVIADPRAPASLLSTANRQKANVLQAVADYQIIRRLDGRAVFESEHTQLQGGDGLLLPDAPAHQYDNMAGVIAAVMMMQEKLPLTITQIEQGLSLQSLAGRLQLIPGTPPLLLDVSHNDASVMAMLNYLDGLQVPGRIHAVFGALADKRYEQAYALLKKKVSSWYLASLGGERGQTASALSTQMFSDTERAAAGGNITLFDTPELAYIEASRQAEKRDLIVIFGSFHIVGAIIAVLNR